MTAAAGPTFLPMPERPDFAAEELKTLEHWQITDAYEESRRRSLGRPAFNFYDGPPFATGLPHYGHILAGTIKDTVLRHAYQRGYHIDARFGWDCHGVPIEGIIDKERGIKGRSDVEAFGLANYNEACRDVVLKYEQDWYKITRRYGRWVDMENNWKTMDLSYMESVWWVFSQLWEKGMVYRAFRVIGYSTALSTPLSNFEVAQNYKEVRDPSVIVRFKRRDREGSYILCWTTTPWTLPTNMGLCVHPDEAYVHVKRRDTGEEWLCGAKRFGWVCGLLKLDRQQDFEVLNDELLGRDLEHIPYEPVFDYYSGKAREERCWRVLCDSYVTASAGTMVVHQAPAFGEDDMRVCQRYGIISKDGAGMPDPVDGRGCFTSDVPDFEGVHVKAADPGLIEKLRAGGHLVYSGVEVHNYPHCWRSDTPLIYKAIPAWFIKVEEIRDRLLACNAQTHWVPDFVKEKRFKNWLQEARDWCVSRSRYWGAPLPLWVSDDFEEVRCVGSVEELERLSGRKITDIHRHCIDDILIPSQHGKGMLRRVDEVFDCWFESGAMPYASKHYPFEKPDEWQEGFPAQFIGEGLDQTRGWFYSLMVLGTILFDKPPFLNLICNGLVLAADGKKMSKRLQNYPDPSVMFSTYGADAVRLYMCNSPVVRAEPLRFKEEGVRDVVKDVCLPLYNACRFLVLEVTRLEDSCGRFTPDLGKRESCGCANVMDRWIQGRAEAVVSFVKDEMAAYRLYSVAGAVIQWLNDLTNWYIRLNRDRMRGRCGKVEAQASLSTLFGVLLKVVIVMAPLTPMITEHLYQNLSRALPAGHCLKSESVHFVLFPDCEEAQSEERDISRAVRSMQSVVELGRLCREQKKVGIKMPVRQLKVFHTSEAFLQDVRRLSSYLQEELNVVEVVCSTDISRVRVTPALNFRVLGKRLGRDMKSVQEAVAALSQEQVRAFEADGRITVVGYELTRDELSIRRSIADQDEPSLHASSDGETVVVMDFTQDEELGLSALARGIVTAVQKLRREAGLQSQDDVDVHAVGSCAESASRLLEVLKTKADYFTAHLRRPPFSHAPSSEVAVIRTVMCAELAGGRDLQLSLVRPSTVLAEAAA